MNILYLSTDPGIPLPGLKGASIHVHQMSRALQQEGASVHVVAARGGEGPWLGPRLTVWSGNVKRCGPNRQDLMRQMLELAQKVADDFYPDVIYERYALFGNAGVRLARRLGVPLLLEVNAPLVWEEARYRGLENTGEAARIESDIWRSATRLLVVSQALTQFAASRGVSLDRIDRIPNGFDPDRFYPEGLARERPEPLRDKSMVVGFVGSLKPWHGVDTLLRAMAPHPDVGCWIVGHGPERGSLEGLVETLGLQDRVVFEGSVPPEEVRMYYQSMDLVAAPYRLDDNVDFYFSPLKIVEAMATGRPVVAPGVGEIGEWLEEDRGFIYQPDDVDELSRLLGHLASHPELLESAGHNAARWVRQNRTWNHAARSILDLTGKGAR